MRHHTHSVESGLSVEQHIVAVLKGALNDGAVAEMLLNHLGLAG